MNKDSCIVTPEAPNGEPSKLYKDMLKKLNDRSLTNWLYALYKVIGASKMDPKGLDPIQKEHTAQDFLKFINIDSIELERGDIRAAERHIGAKDIMGNTIDYTDAEAALKKVDKFNDSHKGLIAEVVQHGDVFNIIVSQKNARTQLRVDRTKKALQAWDIYKQVFNAVGVDINNIPQELKNTINATYTDLGKYLRSIASLDMGNIYRRDALILFSLSPNSKHVKNLINAFGSIEEAAQAIDDFNHGSRTLTSAQQTLLVRAIKDAKKFSGVDMNAVVSQIDQMLDTFEKNSAEQTVADKLKELDNKYHINKLEISRTTKRITSLSEAAQEACATLNRRIAEIKKERGRNAEGKRLSITLNQMLNELANKHYSYGIFKFLSEASSCINEIENMIQNTPQTGNDFQQCFEMSKTIQTIKTIKDQYYAVLCALASDSLTIDESIGKTDIDNIRKEAKNLVKTLDKYLNSNQGVINDLMEENMIHLMFNLGMKKGPDGQSIANVVRMAAVDSSIFDHLYGISTASNPMVAAMGSIMRRWEDKRDEKLNEIDLRVRRATYKLYKKHNNSEFMYEDDGHIISDIDWTAYEDARRMEIRNLRKQGLDDFDFKQALEDWEDQNTEDRVVDKTNGRTERVPNDNYRKTENFQKDWTDEQKEYYDTMMQIKGEIGSVLPAYAQKQFLPPQLRRKFMDAISNAKNAKDILKASKTKLEDYGAVREDNTDYAHNGIIDGEEFNQVEGGYDDTPLQQIPIFFVNKVEQGELLKNFSSGIMALAGTALNYEAMSQIQDTVEFMGDFIKDQAGREPKNKKEVIENSKLRIVKQLWKRAKNTKTEKLVESAIAQHLYGQKIDPNTNKYWYKLCSNLLAYTSFKGLSSNLPGAVANGLMGEFQMMIEAGAGEFYGWKDYIWAEFQLYGKAGVGGVMMDILSNNRRSKANLMREKFDPLQENYEDSSHKEFHSNIFRTLMSKDCSFIGYTVGEEHIHFHNLYAMMHHKKVYLNGEKISLYDAYEVSPEVDGNCELKLKAGVKKDTQGNDFTKEDEEEFKRQVRGVNQATHGAMNAEDKGIIHQKMLGRLVMNFRQWMVGHYSRRFRGRHWDDNFGGYREGYWTTLKNGVFNERVKELWKDKHRLQAIGNLIKDLYTFTCRSSAAWENLTDDQKANINRVRTEMMIFFVLTAFDHLMGEPEDYKNQAYYRFVMYQIKRMLLDTKAGLPIFPVSMVQNATTLLQSPMASISTFKSLGYIFYGPFTDDIFETIKTGKHKGENRYIRNVKKYALPFYKHYEQMENFSTDDTIFKQFEFKLGQ